MSETNPKSQADAVASRCSHGRDNAVEIAARSHDPVCAASERLSEIIKYVDHLKDRLTMGTLTTRGQLLALAVELEDVQERLEEASKQNQTQVIEGR